VDELMDNTADAYGFPPFQYLAPICLLGDGDYAELQRRERSVLTAAMSRVRTRRIASNTFGWADTIPELLAADRLAAAESHAPRNHFPHPPLPRHAAANGVHEAVNGVDGVPHSRALD